MNDSNECRCKCHSKGSHILHVMPCCNRAYQQGFVTTLTPEIFDEILRQAREEDMRV